MRLRIGKRQESFLLYLYNNLCDGLVYRSKYQQGEDPVYLRRDYDHQIRAVSILRFVSDRYPDMTDYGFRVERNFYFTIWSGVKRLERRGLVRALKRSYHYHRPIYLTPEGRELVENRYSVLIPKRWDDVFVEYAKARCDLCYKWNNVINDGYDEFGVAINERRLPYSFCRDERDTSVHDCDGFTAWAFHSRQSDKPEKPEPISLPINPM